MLDVTASSGRVIESGAGKFLGRGFLILNPADGRKFLSAPLYHCIARGELLSCP